MLPKMNVKICATHSGVTVGEDGATHQNVRRFRLMRRTPNMTVLCTSDDTENSLGSREEISKIHKVQYMKTL